ncbi:MAG: GntR family transcriptional regulator [Bacteroidales bacterium]
MDFKNGQPIYLQIADYICERILKKDWKEGTKLPSIRDTAVKLEVNPNTVIRTYNFLQNKGIIYNQRGIGYFVAEGGVQKTMTFKKEIFVREELPRIFHTMDILRLDTKDIEKYYQRYKLYDTPAT